MHVTYFFCLQSIAEVYTTIRIMSIFTKSKRELRTIQKNIRMTPTEARRIHRYIEKNRIRNFAVFAGMAFDQLLKEQNGKGEE